MDKVGKNVSEKKTRQIHGALPPPNPSISSEGPKKAR